MCRRIANEQFLGRIRLHLNKPWLDLCRNYILSRGNVGKERVLASSEPSRHLCTAVLNRWTVKVPEGFLRNVSIDPTRRSQHEPLIAEGNLYQLPQLPNVFFEVHVVSQRTALPKGNSKESYRPDLGQFATTPDLGFSRGFWKLVTLISGKLGCLVVRQAMWASG